MAGEGTEEEAVESLRLVWPAYFADPENVPPMLPIRVRLEAYSGLLGHITEATDQIAADLAASDVRFGVLAGAASPIPWGQAARATAELSPRAFLTIVPAAGHFPWLEAPGAVRSALERLSI